MAEQSDEVVGGYPNAEGIRFCTNPDMTKEQAADLTARLREAAKTAVERVAPGVKE